MKGATPLSRIGLGLRLHVGGIRPVLPRPFKLQAGGQSRGLVPWPLITEVGSGGWRQSDIFSKLLQERIVCLYGGIDDSLAASVVAQLLWLESDNAEKPITMYINSPGGSITAGLAVYDTMTYISPPVSTVCIGAASSMGSLLLTGGAAGKRFSLPHSSIMIHQPLGGTHGQASDILIYATQMQRIREQVNKIYCHHLNLAAGYERYDLQAVHDVMERDKYMSPEEAKEYGIIDEILQRREISGEEKPPGDGKSSEAKPKEGEAKTSKENESERATDGPKNQ